MIQIIAAGGAVDMNYNQHFVTGAVKDSHVRDSLLSAPVFAAAPYHSFGYIRRRHACH